MICPYLSLSLNSLPVNNMLLIIDNKSKFIKKFEKSLKKKKIDFKIVKAGQRIDLKKFKKASGVILSGGSLGLYSKSITNDFVALINFKVPIIGFCMGHEVIGVAFGGMIKKLPRKQNKIQGVIIDKPRDPIFKGLGKKVYLREKHANHLYRQPKDFKILAHSEVCPIEVMKHKKRKIYGFQSHPEVSGPTGEIIMRNFLKMCKIKY